MGRGRGRGRGGGRGGGKRQHSGGDGGGYQEKRPRTDAWKKPEDVETNGLFEEYYKGQGVCPPEEWDEFILTLKKPLPITFRINGQGKFADRLLGKMESNFIKELAAGPVVIDGEPVEAPHPLDWYPGKLAWQMNFSRSQLRKNPLLEQLHEFIKRENEVGSITRQEAVSMVPPLFLDVEPHHRVLDMCAAPGSKTFQLLEMLHAGPGPATGLVVANDADIMRCNLLSHQTKRMCSPALLVTNHEAQQFPMLRNLLPGSTEKHVLFDRILCDVPCSGDGTMRKAPDIWRRWGTGSGNGLHSLQLRITLRACELLRVGGRLVYSTCTFNPVEDEAVVAEVLRRTKGAFELLDVSDRLPGLKRLPGMQRWRVKDINRWYDSWEEGKEGIKLDPSMFPDEQSDAMPLHRCMRFLPHHQNTGGFFVCVLQKVRELDGPLEQVNLDHRNTRTKERKAAAAEQQQQQAGEEPQQAGDVKAEAEAAEVKAEPEPEAEAAEVKAEPEAEAEAAEVKAEPEAEAEAAEVKAEAEAEAEAAEVKAEAEAEAEAMDTEGAAEEPAAADGAAAAAAGEGKPGWRRRQQQELPTELPEWGIRGGGGRNRQGGRFRGVDPIVPYVDREQLEAIKKFYGLAPDCPVPEALIARSTDARPKKLHYVSAAVKELLRLDVREQIKVVGAGVKILERQDSKDGLVPCVYRFAQDGLPALLPHVTRQRFEPTVEELLAILQQRMVGMPQGHRLHITKGPEAEAAAAAAAAATAKEEGEKPAAVDGAPADGAAAAAGQPAAAEEGQSAAEPAAQQQQQEAAQQPAPAQQQAPRFFLHDERTLRELQDVAMGCCVAIMRPEDAAALGLAGEEDQGATEGGLPAAAPVAISCWRGRGTLNVLVSKQEAAQLADKILEAQAKQQAAGGAAAGQGEAAEAAAAEPVAA